MLKCVYFGCVDKFKQLKQNVLLQKFHAKVAAEHFLLLLLLILFLSTLIEATFRHTHAPHALWLGLLLSLLLIEIILETLTKLFIDLSSM